MTIVEFIRQNKLKSEDEQYMLSRYSQNLHTEIKCISEIPDYAEYDDYFVSADGACFSIKHGKLKELKTFLNKDGYLRVKAIKYGVKKDIKLHRIVA